MLSSGNADVQPGTVEYILRPAHQSDLEPMMAIAHEAFRPTVEAVRGWDQQKEERGFKDHFVPEHIKIIEVGGIPAGYYCLEKCEHYDFLGGIYLSAKHRGQGLGSAVLKETIDLLNKALRLRVYKCSKAISLYRRIGFEVIEELDDRYVMECRNKLL